MLVRLDRLDDAVRRPRDCAQAAPDPSHRLVVPRPDRELVGAEDAPDAARGLDAHRVLDGASLRMAVQDVLAVVVGDVRDEIAAERDVQHLHATTDAEEGQVGARDRGPGELELEAVALERDAVVRPVRRAAVARRVDVAAAGEDEALDRFQRLGNLAFDRRQHDGDAASAADGVDVVARQREAPALPGATVARDADQGASHDRQSAPIT